MKYRVSCRSYFSNRPPHEWCSGGVYDIGFATQIVLSIRRQFDGRANFMGMDCWTVPA